ncbi:MAG: lysophospholipid acyltransferase family protein [Dehalococcoidia bacterium]
MTWLYRVFHYAGIPLVFALWTRLRVEGREHVAVRGPLILLSNHVDNWDTYVLGLFVRDRVVNYLARPAGLRSGLLGWYWRQLGGIPADRRGLMWALQILKHGGAVGIFPEGMIAPALVPAVPGAALLARRSGALVVPTAVWGTEHIRPWSIISPPRVTVRYGRPRTLARGPGRSEAVMDELMREIAAMLPRRYQGVYADGSSCRCAKCEESNGEGGRHRHRRGNPRRANRAGDVGESARRPLGRRRDHSV